MYTMITKKGFIYLTYKTMQEYTPFILFILGVCGVFVHNLIKLGEARKNNAKSNFLKYWTAEKYSIMASLIIVLVSVILSQEIKQMEQFGHFLGLGFFAIGYTGQSMIISRFGKTK